MGTVYVLGVQAVNELAVVYGYGGAERVAKIAVAAVFAYNVGAMTAIGSSLNMYVTGAGSTWCHRCRPATTVGLPMEPQHLQLDLGASQ